MNVGEVRDVRLLSCLAYDHAVTGKWALRADRIFDGQRFLRGPALIEAVVELTRRIHEDFTYDPKATTVATPLADVFKSRRGVCQDFARLEIACLRTLGLPARYISGYLETVPPRDRPRDGHAAAPPERHAGEEQARLTDGPRVVVHDVGRFGPGLSADGSPRVFRGR